MAEWGGQTLMASMGYITVCSCDASESEVLPRSARRKIGGAGWLARSIVKRTAIPAKAPAAMFCISEKLGGSDS